jgi:hypothetical protein
MTGSLPYNFPPNMTPTMGARDASQSLDQSSGYPSPRHLIQPISIPHAKHVPKAIVFHFRLFTSNLVSFEYNFTKIHYLKSFFTIFFILVLYNFLTPLHCFCSWQECCGTCRPGTAASDLENSTYYMGSPQISGALFRSFPKPHSSPKMKLR